MQFTNKLNLPGPMVRALSNDGYRAGDDNGQRYISVTQLINPPRQAILKRRHEEALTEDVSDRIWSLLGQSVHAILEAAETESSIVEERLYMEIDGVRIGGMTDLYEDGVLTDFKITSVWSVIFGGHDEWAAQTNLNAMLYRNAGFEVKKVQIIAILRDWQESKALTDRNYPQQAVKVIEQPLWTQEECVSFAKKRVELFNSVWDEPDHKLPLCTPEERWRRGDSFAVKKVGNKKATRVADSLEEAEKIKFTLEKEGNGKFEIEARPGQDLRCLRYCVAAPFCSYYKGLNVHAEGAE
jgi:hypothetical protein